ncbi:hypothetical protein [Flavobacterium sp. NKUCC04_CG]|uniref:hypothetical protein n=1 Tax=Flavobacterium sp. NKUCC04_CG TaxID=2842121 RepID=UPI001C5A92BB|nr:hypothetical protein [Flavobacterium sp. NKUCC04_CG]MBW3519502.1 hypothetical protein [Flavobacterium sp. NKUCC04_CG]
MDSQVRGSEGEEFVNELAFKSFFKYWCYPSPKYENGNKKEICDLLIIFDEIVIIFSVKNYVFKGNHFRYFNNTIDKASKQIKGAHRTLFSEKEIIIKHPDRDKELFQRERIKKVFRVIVNLGENLKFYPFNTATNNDDFITLFDRDTFETILSELDTIPDFIDYLEKREKIFKNKRTFLLPSDEDDFPIEAQEEFFQLSANIANFDFTTVFISGKEKDLLAHFIENKRVFPDILNNSKTDHFYLIVDGKWETFIENKSFKQKKEADEISYFVDRLVENEFLVNVTPSREIIAKHLLSFDRLTRRSFAKSYCDFYEKYGCLKGLYFGRRLLKFNNIGVIFTSYTDEMTEEMFQRLNALTVESFNLYIKYKYKTMILISTNKDHCFKFSLIDNITPYSKEEEDLIIEDVKTLGWFTELTEGKLTEREFPI